MDKFCGYCGSQLNENGLCPNCTAKKQQDAPTANTLQAQNNVSEKNIPQPASSLEKSSKVDTKADLKAKKDKKTSNKDSNESSVSRAIRAIKVIISIICVLIIAATVCFSLVYYDVVDIPPVNSFLVKLDMIEETAPTPTAAADGSKTPNTTEDKTPTDTAGEDKTENLTEFTSNYFDIHVGNYEYVTFTVKVENADEIETDKLAVYDVSGEVISYMTNNGYNGDESAEDNIYTTKVRISSDEAQIISYYASDGITKSNEFDISFYKDISYTDYKSFSAFIDSLNGLTYEKALEIIKNSDEVVLYTADDTTRTVSYKSVYGFTGIHEEELTGDTKGNGENALPKDTSITQQDYTEAGQILENMNPVIISNIDKDVLVVRPFRESQFTYDDFKYAGEIISAATGGSLHVEDESNADISAFKSFDDYGTVLIDSHGTLVNNNTPYIITGETFSNYSSYEADYYGGRIAVRSSGRLAVNGDFFNKYYTANSLSGSFIFLGCCHSLADESIANALISKGASAVAGYTDTVTVSYCNLTLFETLINSMAISTDSAKNGIECAKEFYGDTDPGNSDCELSFSWDDSYAMFISGENKTSSKMDIVLVLDRSGSMAGTPIEETKIAAAEFVENILGEEASIGIVTYESGAEIVSYTTDNEYALTNSIDGIYTGGGTNIGAGLQTACSMLEESEAEKKIIVLMSDSEPNEGLVGENLIAYADSIKDDGICIYTLGFFEALTDKYNAQSLMTAIASEGCHYEAADVSDLVFFFRDIAEQINGQRYYHIRIACPVDVTVEYNGETLTSDEGDLSTRTSFGTLTFEESENASGSEKTDENSSGSSTTKDNRVKILRLKEGVNYNISINGNGKGKMTYAIGFMDKDGEYTDHRIFKDIEITKATVIDTVAANTDKTTLKVDEDGDGEYDLIYRAEKDSRSELVDHSKELEIIFKTCTAAAGVLLLLIIESIVECIIRKKIRKKKAGA